MKNIFFLVAVVLCLALAIFGIWQKQNNNSVLSDGLVNEAKEQQFNNTDNLSNPIKNIDKASDAVTEATDKKYYPSDASVDSTSIGYDNSARNFQITPALLVKMHLADTYNPGICFGEPTAVPQSAITSMLSSQKELAEFLRQHYKLSGDLEVYNKIKQFQGFDLRETASSRFDFIFKDGQCYYYEYYRGQAEVSGNEIKVKILEQESHNYQ